MDAWLGELVGLVMVVAATLSLILDLTMTLRGTDLCHASSWLGLIGTDNDWFDFGYSYDSGYIYDSEGYWTTGIEQGFRTRPLMCDIDCFVSCIKLVATAHAG